MLLFSAPGLPQLPHITPKNPPPSIISVPFSAKMRATSIIVSGWLEVNLFLFRKWGGKNHFDIILVSAVSGRNLKVLHSQPFAATNIHADKAGSQGACLADGFEDHAAC